MNRCCIAFLAFCSVLTASPIYQINFSGTIASGILSDLRNDGSNTFYTADLTGIPISGSLTYDLGIASAPVVSNGTFITTAINQDDAPVFITESVTLAGLVLPANVLAVPTTFALTRETPPSGAAIQNPSIDHQQLSFSTQPNGANQAILSFLHFFDSWDAANADVTRNIQVGLDLSSSAQFLPSTGGIPANWTLSNSATNSTFTFSDFFGNPQSFNPATNYRISGTFTVNEASGGYVVPEPASIEITALGLALAIGAAAKSRRLEWVCSLRRLTAGLARFFDV